MIMLDIFKQSSANLGLKPHQGQGANLHFFHNIQQSLATFARMTLEPWTFALEIGSSGNWRVIIVPGQEANGDSL